MNDKPHQKNFYRLKGAPVFLWRHLILVWVFADQIFTFRKMIFNYL